MQLGEKTFREGDLNGHIGSTTKGYEGLHVGYGIVEVNAESKVPLRKT